LRKDVFGLARDGDGQRVALLPHGDLGILRRQQHLVIDLVREPLHQALQLREVEHVMSLGVEATFDHAAGAVVVAVQRRAAASGPSLRAMWVSGAAARSVRNVSTTASLQGRPSASARRSAGAPTSKVRWKSVAYSRAIASRGAARAMAARSVTVGGRATSW